jgi:glycosyltransferase involved in cell wall biosynthesis
MTYLSVVIPVLNESTLIGELIKRVKSNVELITKEFEIILVDDGSDDSTWEVIESQAATDTKVKGIKFSRNFGHHYAITAGLHKSGGEWVVVMDGDLQDRPEVIPQLHHKAQEGFDVVFVSRMNRPEKILYMIIQRMFYWLLRNFSGINFNHRQANFSILNRKVVEAFKTFPENSRFYVSTVLWLGFNQTQIFADHGRRFSGRSSYTFKKRLKLGFDIIFSFSERPLIISIWIGFLFAFLSLLLSLIFVIQYLRVGFSVTGWTSLIVSLFFLSGLVFIFIGIMGIYLGRIYQQVKGRPLFILSKTVNID